MTESAFTTQPESKSKTAGIPVRPSEKAAIEGLARLLELAESDLLRKMLILDIVTEFERVQGLMEKPDLAQQVVSKRRAAALST